MKDFKNVRIIDVAQKVGVSKGTVDRVMHNRGDVKKETRDKILAAIEELGYKPNLLAKTLSGKKNYSIAVLIPEINANNPYWEKLHLGIQRASQEVSDFNTVVELFSFSTTQPESFSLAMTEVIKQNVDAVVLHPFFQDEAYVFTTLLDSQNIPYVYIDIDLKRGNNLAYFGQNAFQSGLVAAKLMAMGIKNQSRVLVLRLTANSVLSHHLSTRTDGFLSYFEDHPCREINCESRQVDLFVPGELSKVLDEELTKSSPLAGIFIPGSRGYKVSALLSDHRDIRVVGYDLIDQNIEEINSGGIDVLISQRPVEQGYKSVMSLFHYIMTNAVMAKINYAPIDIIVKENVDFYNEGKW